MKSTLRNYFFDRLSSREEKKVQEYICTNKESEELNDALRDLFDECLAPEGKQVRHVQWGRIALISLASAAVAALLVLIPVSYKAGMDAGEDRIASIEWVEVNVPSGQKQTVTLSDGTVLHLNSGSRLTYPAEFSGNSRTIFMDGEAFLDVAKDPDHPFIIKSQNVDVTVLGTSFNFRNFAQERMAELLLMEGSVEACVSIQDDTRTVRLRPGDKMRYNRLDGKMDIERFAPASYKAFYRDNSLHFFDMEMADIAKELSRRFNCDIVVMDEELASRRYFSIFTNNETLDQILSVMSSDGKMRVRRSGKTIYLQSK
ncbi:MAG: FecR domain-containing protein [Bacteroidales bacterium]|nr:FecR domain-containing protein [Bacteroidales bacterium]